MITVILVIQIIISIKMSMYPRNEFKKEASQKFAQQLMKSLQYSQIC
jgi:RNase H-fold protein (predicted Holliday junction resolvase)